MENISKIKLPNNTIYNIIDNQPAIGSSSGELCSFSDGSNLPMPSLKVGIEPVQDLHGYDAPWVGGAGKNKLPNNLTTVTAFGVTYVTQEDGSIIANGTATAWANAQIATGLLLKGGEQYILSGIPNVNGAYITIVKADGTSGSWSSTYATPSINISFEEDTLVNVRLSASIGTVLNNAKYKPMIRLASVTDSTFAPYSNICPITGHTGVNAFVRGKNLLPMTVDGIKAVNTSGTWTGNAYALNGVTFTILTDDNGNITGIKANGTANTNRVDLYLFKAQKIDIYNGKILSGMPSNIDGQRFYMGLAMDESPWTSYTDRGNGVTIGDYDSNILGSVYITARKDYELTDVMVYPMLRLPDASADFAPYNPQSQTIQVSWQTEAGEVYGGYVNLVSGQLTVDRASVDLGSLSWSYDATIRRFSATVQDKKMPTTTRGESMLCSCFIVIDDGRGIAELPNGCVYSSAGSLSIYIHDNRYSDASTFKTSVTGQTLVYELAAPIIYHLTPIEVKSLLGSNNVWADTGEIIDCEYVRDKYDSITAKIAEHVDWTGVNNKPTIPTAVNNVTQTATTVTSDTKYELLFSNTADNTNRTEGTRKSSLLTFSPKPAGVELTMNYDGSRPNNYGDITIKGNNDSDSYITLHSSSAGMSYLWIKHPTPSVGIFLEGGSRSNSSSDYSQGAISADDFVVSGYDWEGNNITWDGTNTSLKAAIQSLNDRVTALENT